MITSEQSREVHRDDLEVDNDDNVTRALLDVDDDDRNTKAKKLYVA